MKREKKKRINKKKKATPARKERKTRFLLVVVPFLFFHFFPFCCFFFCGFPLIEADARRILVEERCSTFAMHRRWLKWPGNEETKKTQKKQM
jgi:hypothetical protein